MATAEGRSSPVLLRRRLGGELRRHREARGLTIEQVAAHLDNSKSTVSRIENGRISVSISVVRDLLVLYQVEDPQRTAIERIARGARYDEPWWHTFGDVPDARMYAGYERAAQSIRAYDSLIFPGLLQTPAYARVILGAIFPDMAQEIELHVRLRMSRQSLLASDDPPTLSVVLDEAALRRLQGMGRQLQQEQLGRLIEMADLPNVSLQVLPFRAGAHGGMIGQFTILSFADPADPDLVHIEHRAGDLVLDREDHVRRYGLLFERLQAISSTPEASVAFLKRLDGGGRD